MDAVHRHEGYVAQSTGDGIVAFFGAPVAHEYHPSARYMQTEKDSLAEQDGFESPVPVVPSETPVPTTYHLVDEYDRLAWEETTPTNTRER